MNLYIIIKKDNKLVALKEGQILPPPLRPFNHQSPMYFLWGFPIPPLPPPFLTPQTIRPRDFYILQDLLNTFRDISGRKSPFDSRSQKL